VIQIVAVVVVLCVFAGLIALTVAMPLPPAWKTTAPSCGGWGHPLHGAVHRRRSAGCCGAKAGAAQFDAAFGPLGLTGSNYMLHGRQYHGQVNGRQVDIYFYRGPILDIYVAAPLHTRMGIGMTSRLGRAAAGMLNRQPFQASYPELAQLSIYPADERWGGELLDDPQARAAILRLMEAPGSYEIRNLLFQPEAIQLQANHLHPNRITPQAASQWLQDLLFLARLAESLPAPTVTAQASGAERTLRSDRNRLYWIVAGVTCGVFALMMVFLLIASLVTVYFLEAGG
jgi:hypothetical protein